MQFAKDSFFVALQQRLAALNSSRVITVNGATVPAILVVENLPPYSADPQPNTFYVEWGEAGVIEGHAGNNPMMSLDCVISYYTIGTVQSMVDRGRVLGELDEELLGMCQPPNTEKRDYTQSPSADLGTSVFWGQPLLGESKKSAVTDNAERYQDARVERKAQLTIYFFSEVILQ
jgi:hypothetical protein